MAGKRKKAAAEKPEGVKKAAAEEPEGVKKAAAEEPEGGKEAGVGLKFSPRRTRSYTAREASGQAEKKPEPSKKKSKPSKGKKITFEDNPEPQQEAEEDEGPVEDSRTVIIEACKQCNSFKTRASTVKAGLEAGVPGITVTINPEKPRKGCFEVRTGSGEKFLSLLNMPRPFKKMKDLDMDEVIADIVKKLNE